MNFEFDSKNKLILTGFFVAFVIIVSILYGTTDLFKGFTGGEVITDGQTIEAEISLTEKLSRVVNGLDEVQLAFDDLLALAESEGADGYENFDTLATELSEFSTLLDEINTDTAAIDPLTFDSLTDEEKIELSTLLDGYFGELSQTGELIQNYETELSTYLDSILICPIDEDDTNALVFAENHATFKEIIAGFNNKDYFNTSDMDDLKDFIVSLTTTNNAASETGCLDFSAHTQSEIDEEREILLTSFETKTTTEIINFGNAAISTYNSNIVECYVDAGCVELVPISQNIESKVYCSAGQEYNAATNTCVGAVCPTDELMDRMDLVYDILGNYTETPELFDDDALEALIVALDDLYTFLEEPFDESDLDDFDYETDLNDYVDELNRILGEESNSLCTVDDYEEYEVVNNNNNNNNGEAELSCPDVSLPVPEVGLCVCPDETVVEPGETCDDPEESDNPPSFVCPDGLIVEDQSECVAEDDEGEDIVLNQDNDDNEDDEEPSGSQTPNQNNNSLHGSGDLSSNTQGNVLQGPVIQGDTGSEAIAVVMVIMIAVFNIYLWTKKS